MQIGGKFLGGLFSKKYEDSVHDFSFSTIFTQGTVCEKPKNQDGSVILFPIAVSDYIRGGNKKTILWYVYFFSYA